MRVIRFLPKKSLNSTNDKSEKIMRILVRLLLVLLFIAPTLLIAQAPVANFSASATAICDSTFSENFTDLSSNNPTSWEWCFPGATPDTSSLQNPTNIVYNGIGCYTVKLVVKNGSGSDSLIDSNYICLDAPPHIILSGISGGCIGYPTTLTASGGTSYYWSLGETTSSIILDPIISLIINVEVSNGACFKDSTFYFVADTMPHVRFTGDTSICKGDTTTIHVLAARNYTSFGYSYMWNTGSTADSIFINGATSGLYNYYVTVTKGACINDSVPITVDVHLCTGINNLTYSSGQITVYPNPSTGQFTLQSSVVSCQWSVEVYNMLGEKVYTATLPPPNRGGASSSFQINLSSETSGIYLYRVISETGNLLGEGKLVIQK